MEGSGGRRRPSAWWPMTDPGGVVGRRWEDMGKGGRRHGWDGGTANMGGTEKIEFYFFHFFYFFFC